MPNTCCHNDKGGSYVSNDTCMCGGCSYFNGWAPIVGVQLLAMIGMFFSIAAFGDCSFMELNERLFFPPDMFEENFKDNSDLPIEVTQTQFVGFLTWKKLDGSCYWYNSGLNPEEQIKTFVVDILGRDWEIPRIFSGLSASLSILFFCYLLSFTCSSQTRGVRYFNTVFLCLILTTLQGLTFYDNSTFCEEYICTYSRTAGFSAAAIGCFFLSGLCFCCTHDYSGPRRKNKHTIYRIAPVERVVSAPPQTAASKVAPTTVGDKSETKVVGGRNSVRESRPREENYDTSTYRNNEVRSQSSLTYLEKSYLQLKKQQKQQQEQQHSQVDSPRSNNEINNNSSEHPISHEPETKPQYYSSADISDDEEMIEEIMEDYETDEVEVCSVTTSGTSIADNTDKNKDFIEETTENDCDDDFIAHPDLEEGDDCEVITEVTKDEIKVVETIRHADGSQTITETYEERADEKGYI